MRKAGKKLVLTRETLKPLDGGLHLVATASESVIIGCIPHTERICPITTTL
jgi:hypothetical protein